MLAPVFLGATLELQSLVLNLPSLDTSAFVTPNVSSFALRLQLLKLSSLFDVHGGRLKLSDVTVEVPCTAYMSWVRAACEEWGYNDVFNVVGGWPHSNKCPR